MQSYYLSSWAFNLHSPMSWVSSFGIVWRKSFFSFVRFSDIFLFQFSRVRCIIFGFSIANLRHSEACYLLSVGCLIKFGDRVNVLSVFQNLFWTAPVMFCHNYRPTYLHWVPKTPFFSPSCIKINYFNCRFSNSFQFRCHGDGLLIYSWYLESNWVLL